MAIPSGTLIALQDIKSTQYVSVAPNGQVLLFPTPPGASSLAPSSVFEYNDGVLKCQDAGQYLRILDSKLVSTLVVPRAEDRAYYAFSLKHHPNDIYTLSASASFPRGDLQANGFTFVENKSGAVRLRLIMLEAAVAPPPLVAPAPAATPAVAVAPVAEPVAAAAPAPVTAPAPVEKGLKSSPVSTAVVSKALNNKPLAKGKPSVAASAAGAKSKSYTAKSAGASSSSSSSASASSGIDDANTSITDGGWGFFSVVLIAVVFVLISVICVYWYYGLTDSRFVDGVYQPIKGEFREETVVITRVPLNTVQPPPPPYGASTIVATPVPSGNNSGPVNLNKGGQATEGRATNKSSGAGNPYSLPFGFPKSATTTNNNRLGGHGGSGHVPTRSSAIRR